MNEDLVTPQQAAQLLGISEKTITTWIERGWLGVQVTPHGQRQRRRVSLARARAIKDEEELLRPPQSASLGELHQKVNSLTDQVRQLTQEVRELKQRR
jgi:predicted site-specific integrase-resolvase